jgi:antirestriction protein ArdC
MKFYNEMDVIEICARAGAQPELVPYARYLLAWMRIVNENSDGWAYWRAGAAAGIKLADLLVDATAGKPVAKARWGQAIGGIKRAASAQAKYGNRVPVPTLELS